MNQSTFVLRRVISPRAPSVTPVKHWGRASSALALTAVLASVQLILVAAHTGADLCRLADGACAQLLPIVGGVVLEAPLTPLPQAVQGAQPSSGVTASVATAAIPSQAQSPLQLQTVAFTIPSQTSANNSQPAPSTKASSRGNSAAHKNHHAVQNAAAKSHTKKHKAPKH